MNHCLVHQATIVSMTNLTVSLGSVQLDTTAMEAQSTVTLSIKLLVIGVQRATTVQLKVPTQLNAYQVLMLTQNTTSSRTTVSLVSLECSARLLDLTIQVEIVLKDTTALQEKHSRVLQTRSASLVTTVLRVVAFTTHAQLELINHIPGKDFATPALLAVTVILMKLDRTCFVQEMALVELSPPLIVQRDITAPMVPNGPSSIRAP